MIDMDSASHRIVANRIRLNFSSENRYSCIARTKPRRTQSIELDHGSMEESINRKNVLNLNVEIALQMMSNERQFGDSIRIVIVVRDRLTRISSGQVIRPMCWSLFCVQQECDQ